jgi:hypothetical protein
MYVRSLVKVLMVGQFNAVGSYVPIIQSERASV